MRIQNIIISFTQKVLNLLLEDHFIQTVIQSQGSKRVSGSMLYRFIRERGEKSLGSIFF